MDRVLAVFHQHPIAGVAFGILMLVFLWGALGTTQRRRNLKHAFFGSGFSARKTLGADRLAEVMTELEPVIDSLKKLRRKCRFVTAIFLIGIGIVFAIDGLVPEYNIKSFVLFAGIFLVFLPNVYYVYYGKKKSVPLIAQKMGFLYKGKGMNLFQTLLEDEQKIQHTYGVAFGSFQRSILLGSFERYSVEDGFSSSAIRFQEVHTWMGREDDDSDARQDTKFKGLLVRITLPEPFDCPVLLREDMGHIGNRFSFAPKGFQQIALEDPEFESFFEVFSPDQIKARRILTPRFMETIKSVMQYYPSGRVTALIAEKYIYLAVFNHGNLFEVGGILTPIESDRSFTGIITQLEMQKRVLQCFTT